MRKRRLGRKRGLCTAESLETSRRVVIGRSGFARCDVPEVISRCSSFVEKASAHRLHRVSDVCYRLVEDRCIILAPLLSAATLTGAMV